MKNILLLNYIVSTIVILSCSDKQSVNGLSEFTNVNSVSDFALELSIKGNTFKGSFSDDYNAFYFFRKERPNLEKYIPYQSQYVNGKWQEPIVLSYYDQKYSYTYQLKQPYTNKLLFISNKRTKRDSTKTPNYNFWETELIDNVFSKPKEVKYSNLIHNYNSQPCITNSGTIYFTSDLSDWSKTISYKMVPKEDGYFEPILFEPVNEWRENNNWVVYEYAVSPNEDFMIVCIEDKSAKNPSVDMYISYFEDNIWSYPEKLNNDINTDKTENFPTITKDGKYLLFTRDFSQFKIVSIKALKSK